MKKVNKEDKEIKEYVDGNLSTITAEQVDECCQNIPDRILEYLTDTRGLSHQVIKEHKLFTKGHK